MKNARRPHCPFEALCERECLGDYWFCYKETLRTGANPYGKVIRHPHVVVMYEGKRVGKPKKEEKKCIIATVSGCDCQTLHFYRDFRDNFMKRTTIGRLFADFYYAVSPLVVATILRFDFVKTVVKETLTVLKMAHCN